MVVMVMVASVEIFDWQYIRRKNDSRLDHNENSAKYHIAAKILCSCFDNLLILR